MRYVVFAATEQGFRLAEKIAGVCRACQVDIYVHERCIHEKCAYEKSIYEKYICEQTLACTKQKSVQRPAAEVKVRPYKKLADEMAAAFAGYDVLIFIMAAGIVVRSIAPYIVSKLSDPAVLVMDDKGQNIISLLSGHIGRANEITLFLAEALHSNPVITTATDVHKLLAPDVLASRLDMVPYPKRNLVVFNSALLRGKQLVYLLDGSIKCSDVYEQRLQENNVPYELHTGEGLRQRAAELSDGDGLCVVISDDMKLQDSTNSISSTNSTNSTDNNKDSSTNSMDSAGIYAGTMKMCSRQVLSLYPRRLIAGIGCRMDTPVEDILSALADACGIIGWSVERIDRLASTMVKANELGILAAAGSLRLPVEFFDNLQMAGAVKRYGLKESAFVKKNIGVGNVCEAAALCCVKRGRIAMPKRKYGKVTVALIWEK